MDTQDIAYFAGSTPFTSRYALFNYPSRENSLHHFVLNEYGVEVSDLSREKLQLPSFIDALEAALNEQQALFPRNGEVTEKSIAFDKINKPFKFQLLHGLYDKEGNRISSDLGYLTLLVLDNWYTREHGGEVYSGYIVHHWHEKKLNEAKRDRQEEIDAAHHENEKLKQQFSHAEFEYKLLESRLEKEKKTVFELKQQLDAAERDRRHLIESTNLAPGWVYLIREKSEGHYKIGKSIEPLARVQKFMVKLPFKIEPICEIRCANHHRTESDLHTMFADKRIKGTEWFALNDDDVAFICALARSEASDTD